MPDIAWMPNSDEVVVGYNVDDGFSVLEKIYLRLKLTGEETRLLTTGRGQSGFGSVIMDISPDGEWAMLWDVFTTQSLTLLRTNGSGERLNPTPAVWMPIFCPNGTEVCSIKKINGGQVEQG